MCEWYISNDCVTFLLYVARSEEKKKAKGKKKSASKPASKQPDAKPASKPASKSDAKPAAKPQKKNDSGEKVSPTRVKTVECVERADPSKHPTPSSKEKKLTPSKTEPRSDSKMPAKKKSPKPSSKSPTQKKKSGKPTYIEMTHDAIVALKDRKGSSSIAISKWILANHEHTKSTNPNIFKNKLQQYLKQGVKDGRFVKVKSSFKINPEYTKKQKAAARAKEAAKKAAAREKEKANNKKNAELEKKRAEEEAKRKEESMTP